MTANVKTVAEILGDPLHLTIVGRSVSPSTATGTQQHRCKFGQAPAVATTAGSQRPNPASRTKGRAGPVC